MPTILGIESTAHTFGIGIVKNKKVLSNVKRSYSTEQGGIIPLESAKHHVNNKNEIYFEALEKAGIKEQNIDAVAFSQGPGLAPCLIEGMKFAKELSKKLKKPIVPVNHCIAHLEIGNITGTKDPVMLYCSGANTQIIAYASGKYRIFGETLDIGVGNFIDNFARYAGIGFPGGPTIEKLARESKNYVELPYKVKGMDVALSGILTNLKQKLEKMPRLSTRISKKHPIENSHIDRLSAKSHDEVWPSVLTLANLNMNNQSQGTSRSHKSRATARANYTLSDLSYSLQETVFAMLVETAERALAHTGKKELLLGGGVACNSRLQEMCKIMCKERGAKFFCPERPLLVDNAAMIAFLGEIMFKNKITEKDPDIKPRQRTDDVVVKWRR